MIGSLLFGALLLRNAKRNVNPGLSYFEWCLLACAHLLANLHLHFAFCQSKATLPILDFYLCFSNIVTSQKLYQTICCTDIYHEKH